MGSSASKTLCTRFMQTFIQHALHGGLMWGYSALVYNVSSVVIVKLQSLCAQAQDWAQASHRLHRGDRQAGGRGEPDGGSC